MITAEECFNNFVDFEICPLKDYKSKEIINDTKLAMIEFAKLHVTEALKQALEDSPTGSSTDIPSYEDMKDAILNAYPLENIK